MAVTVLPDGTPVRLRIVGEVFDAGTAVFTGADTIAPALPQLRPHEYRIAATDGTDPGHFAQRLTAALQPHGLTAYPNQTQLDPLLVVVQGLTATLTLLLVAVAALGVFNMLVLDLRDRVQDLGVHKALGMTPRQTIAMVVASVTGVGLLGGLIGVPVGVATQHLVVPAMAAGGGLHLPDSFVDVYGPATLLPLTLGGLVIALLGALLPAGWAAGRERRSRCVPSDASTDQSTLASGMSSAVIERAVLGMTAPPSARIFVTLRNARSAACVRT